MYTYEALQQMADYRRSALIAEAELRRLARSNRVARRRSSVDATRTRGAPVRPEALAAARV